MRRTDDSSRSRGDAPESTAALSPRKASIVSGESRTTSIPARTALTAFSAGEPIFTTASMFIASVYDQPIEPHLLAQQSGDRPGD